MRTNDSLRRSYTNDARSEIGSVSKDLARIGIPAPAQVAPLPSYAANEFHPTRPMVAGVVQST